MTRSKRTWLIVTVALAAALFCVATVQAKKPDNPGGGEGGGGGGSNDGGNGGGAIYFSYAGRPYTMNDDGSSVTLLENFPASYYVNFNEEPSRDLHAGKRWFLDGDGLAALSDEGDIVPLDLPPNISHSNPRWGMGDEFLSWVGQRWDDDATSPNFGSVVEGGLYAIDLDFDGQGDILGTVGSPQLLVSFPLVDCPAGTPCADVVAPDIQSHDWSPDGTQFVYDTLVDRELRAYNLDTGSEETILSEGESWSPRWSPAGDQIMFSHFARRRAGIMVVGVDGSDMTQIQTDNNSQHPKVGAWSPTGSHLIFLSDDVFNLDSHIVRATSGGKHKTLLTDERFETGFNALWPLGWRETPASAVAAIPEPRSQLLLMIGLLGCAAFSHRRLGSLRMTAAAVLFFACLPTHAFADTFGSGDNQFTIDFVDIGDPGNSPDTTGRPAEAAGSVSYVYRMGIFEISRDMVTKANAEGNLDVSLSDVPFFEGEMRPEMPAMGVSWNEAARFVNWLNESKGFAPAYKFTSQPGEAGYDPNADIELWAPADHGFDADNPFRHRSARYFLPSMDEWYKAAYYDPKANDGAGGYWNYPIGSDRPPLPVASGTEPETAVYGQRQRTGPADIAQAGGLSPYGIMGMGGNVAEWQETEHDLVNDDSSAVRLIRGSSWSPSSPVGMSVEGFQNGGFPSIEEFSTGFRVANTSVPEPSSITLLGFASLGLLASVRRTRWVRQWCSV